MAQQQLSGELSFASVNAALKQADALIEEGVLDLTGVTRCDSAGLALLLELQRRAKAAGRPLKLTGANAQLQQLIRSYALDGIMAAA